MSETNSDEIETIKNPMFSDATYDKLKYVAQYWLPAAATFYAALATIWNFPYGPEVIGTISAVNIFLGVILGISTKSYNKSDAKYNGSFDVKLNEDGTPAYKLNFDMPLEELEKAGTIVLRVNNAGASR